MTQSQSFISGKDEFFDSYACSSIYLCSDELYLLACSGAVGSQAGNFAQLKVRLSSLVAS